MQRDLTTSQNLSAGQSARSVVVERLDASGGLAARPGSLDWRVQPATSTGGHRLCSQIPELLEWDGLSSAGEKMQECSLSLVCWSNPPGYIMHYHFASLPGSERSSWTSWLPSSAQRFTSSGLALIWGIYWQLTECVQE